MQQTMGRSGSTGQKRIRPGPVRGRARADTADHRGVHRRCARGAVGGAAARTTPRARDSAQKRASPATRRDRNTQDNPQKQAPRALPGARAKRNAWANAQKQAPRALPGARAKRLNTAFNRQHFKATPDEILPWALLLFLTNPFYYMVRTGIASCHTAYVHLRVVCWFHSEVMGIGGNSF